MANTKVSPSGLRNITFGRRNRLPNGDFRIDQINAGTLVTPTSGAYVMDILVLVMSQASKISSQKVAGFISTSPYCAKASVVSAYTPGTSDYFGYTMFVEGLDMADLLWGTENAKPITVSATVKVSVAGTYSFAVKDGAGTRSYVFTKTLVVGENKIIETIPGDVGGTWAIDNTRGLVLRFDFGCGPTYQTSTTKTWVAGNYAALSGATRLVTNASSTYAIGTVQIEAGSVATAFEFLPYQQALAWCQRYYETSVGGSAAVGQNIGYNGADTTMSVGASLNCQFNIRFKTEKRTSPSVTTYNPNANNSQARDTDVSTDCTGTAVDSIHTTGCRIATIAPSNSGPGRRVAVHWSADARM